MRSERLNVATPDGRLVAVWRTSPAESSNKDGPVVIVCPGFGQRMSDLALVALYLSINGATVYRFDPLDHVGLSDGEIHDYSLDSVSKSISACLQCARAREGDARVRVGCFSFSSLPMLEIAAEDSYIDRIVMVAGVMNGALTLERVIGTDYTTKPYQDVPETTVVEGHRIDPRIIWRENANTGCLTLNRSVELLAKINTPVANCVALEDPWISIDECRSAFERSVGTNSERALVELPYDGHDLARNPTAARLILRNMTCMLVGANSQSLESSVNADLVRPSFEDILDVRVQERRMDREQRVSSPGKGSSS